MKPINTKTHGYMDYIMGVFLIASPSLFNLNHEKPESSVFYVLGAATIIYSLMTDYELGFLKVIPMPIHLIVDFLSGLFLAASPWLLGFSETVYGPHLTLGIIEIGAALLTSTQPRRQIL
ncbi:MULTISPECIES: SPW repeat domain-containing protein [Flavobacterium]|uniref:SPW repeat protein n=1 Tax=Flavobacterium anhuiense TaxID=459526 RepID=A0AAC9D302_9FLAO|nr:MULTISPECIES: SPW repeat protein [Flavobacterium]AOC97036.1 SPW repeat protein [Flavobacterium anhuiense]EJG02632.1 hypothetical protein FF52_05395 [Flavobacterium sp. F52]URM35677.1 SPW repeat protein [Flavobacterium anhuiense]